MNRQILINADDFGWTDGHNQAVALAHRSGGLSRASLLCNGASFDEAVRLSEVQPGLQVGIHLTLNEGAPVHSSSALPQLTRQDGSFYDGLSSVLWLWLSGRLRTSEAQMEWRAQIERALEAGVHPTHLDSHKHVHVLPPLLDAAMALANEFGVPYVRCPQESRPVRRGPAGFFLWFLSRRVRGQLAEKGLRCSDHFVGVASSGRMRISELIRSIHEAKPGVTEIMVHPAVITSAVQNLKRKFDWAARYEFEGELQALLRLAAWKKPGGI